MNRPYVLCHMLTSIDGKTTGKFLDDIRCKDAINKYYKMHADNKFASFACGRVTMEEGFTKGYYPDLSKYSNEEKSLKDYVDKQYGMNYAVCFDRYGKLGWISNQIIDELEGYNNTYIIEVLTEQVDQRYLRYLESLEIPYIFAGKDDIDINLALKKLYHYFNITKLLLEGGPTLNTAFLKANAIDEVSIVVAPLIAENIDKPMFLESEIKDVTMANYNKEDNFVTYNYYINKTDYIDINDSLENQIQKYLKLKNIDSKANRSNKTYREISMNFHMSNYDLLFDKQSFKLTKQEYQYVDLSDEYILQPLLVNTLLKVLDLSTVKLHHILERRLLLIENKVDFKKELITHYEYNKNRDKYDTEFNVYSSSKALFELLNDINFNEDNDILNLLRKYNICKEDFFMNKFLLIDEILYSKDRVLSRYLYYKLLVRNHRIKVCKQKGAPELIIINERRLFHKALFDLCEQLY